MALDAIMLTLFPTTIGQVAESEFEHSSKEIRRLRRGISNHLVELRENEDRINSFWIDQIENLLSDNGNLVLSPYWDHHKESI